MKTITAEHKAAMTRGKAEATAISDYLEALDARRTHGRRRRGLRNMADRLEKVKSTVDAATPLKRVQLIQERMDLEHDIAILSGEMNIKTQEDAFVDVVEAYSNRKRIEYATWRSLGVPAAVLKRGNLWWR